MNKTAIFNRPHVVIVGKVNAGKSVIFNKLLNQDAAIVSNAPGTTTDAVTKAMELLPFGPIALIDTAGFLDDTILGREREAKSIKAIEKSNLLLFVEDVNDIDDRMHSYMEKIGNKYKIDILHVLTKVDSLSEKELSDITDKYPNSSLFSNRSESYVEKLMTTIATRLEAITNETEIKSINSIVSRGEFLLMVTPIDSEAPKGRLITPQVQLIRDCLDNGIMTVVVRPDELQSAIDSISKIALVVTDSQAFSEVSNILGDEVPLTSFSIIQSWQRGNFKVLLDGANALDNLKDNSRILIAESCTHNTSHEDIGRVKIPSLLTNKLKMTFNFDFTAGHDFPIDVNMYDLVIHCGGCMMNKKSMLTRIDRCTDCNVPISNYGMVLAKLNGILDRCSEMFI